ncbi:MAG: dTDP-4-dehydrorhamnose 3,5-epimerase [Syntrophothermus sp.]
MKITKTSIAGLLILEPEIFRDDRGYFFESFNSDTFKTLGIEAEFVQDNESCSRKNVLRGLHFQVSPHAQGKLVRVVKGSVLDVAVDLRKDSPDFGKHVSTFLSEENKAMFWIPPGFAHGFIALEEKTVFVYKCSETYHRESERCIRWDDPELNIDWGAEHPLVSEKDAKGISFRDYAASLVNTSMNVGSNV